MTLNKCKSETAGAPQDRRYWMTPKLNKIGTLSEVLGAGGGKVSGSPGDPGEVNAKPSGGGG